MIVVVTVSFLVNYHENILWLWVLVALVSTCYSFSWDVLMDWGLLEEGEAYPLRKILIYGNKNIYKTIIVINFVLRCSWVLTISSNVLEKLIRPELLGLITASLEIIRRTNWNYIRVEWQYINSLKDYVVVPILKFPYSTDETDVWHQMTGSTNVIVDEYDYHAFRLKMNNFLEQKTKGSMQKIVVSM